MKLSITHYDQIVSIERQGDDFNIWETVEMLKQLLLAVGFSPVNVEDAFGGGESTTTLPADTSARASEAYKQPEPDDDPDG